MACCEVACTECGRRIFGVTHAAETDVHSEDRGVGTPYMDPSSISDEYCVYNSTLQDAHLIRRPQ